MATTTNKVGAYIRRCRSVVVVSAMEPLRGKGSTPPLSTTWGGGPASARAPSQGLVRHLAHHRAAWRRCHGNGLHWLCLHIDLGRLCKRTDGYEIERGRQYDRSDDGAENAADGLGCHHEC